MATDLSIVFEEFFCFFSCTFVGVTAVQFFNTPTQHACYDIYYDIPSSICHYVIYIFVYTYTISDGNTFVNTFYKKIMFFFKYNI